MTLPPPTTNLVFTLSLEPRVVRTGAMVRYSLRVRNPGDTEVAVAPSIVVTDVLPHVVVCGLELVRVPGHGTRRIVSHAILPTLPVGKHTAFVKDGQSNSAVLTVST